MDHTVGERSRDSLLLKAEFAALSGMTLFIVIDQLGTFATALRGFLAIIF